MGKGILFFWLIFCITCHFCNKDFKSLGRHAWRCKERNNQNESVANSNHSNVTLEQTDLQNCSPVNSRKIKCICGKETKTHGGLKKHQRTCHAISGFNKDLLSNLAQEIETATSQEDEIVDTQEICNSPDTKVKKALTFQNLNPSGRLQMHFSKQIYHCKTFPIVFRKHASSSQQQYANILKKSMAAFKTRTKQVN